MLQESIILKNPRWNALIPELPTLQEASVPLTEKILAEMNVKGRVYALSFDSNINDCYVIKGKENLFLKVIPEEQLQIYSSIENILSWLCQQGINVAEVIEIRRNFLGSKKIVVVSKYLAGNKIATNEIHLTCLGTQLATLHSVLSRYPNKEKLNTSTLKRLNILQEIRHKIANKTLTVSVEPKLLHNISNTQELDFVGIQNAVPLHGDLNPGNIQISQDNKIIFFDFEDALHSVLPVIFEIIYVLERIVFVSNYSFEEMKRLGRLFLRAYRNNGGNYHYEKRDCYSSMALNLRSLCTLALCEEAGIKTIKSEWEKFYFLYRLSAKRLDLIESILKS